jgi:hypothetical protein
MKPLVQNSLYAAPADDRSRSRRRESADRGFHGAYWRIAYEGEAGYAWAVEFGDRIGLGDAAACLQDHLDVLRAADRRLTGLGKRLPAT